MDTNGHSSTSTTNLLDQTAPIACVGCGHLLDMAAKFCPECGVQRTITPPVASPASSATVTPPAEEASSTATPPPPSDETELTPLPPATETVAAATTQITGGDADVSGSAMDAPPDEFERSVDVASRRPAWRVAMYAALVLVLAAAAAGAYTAYGAMQRRPLVAALSTSSDEFAGAVKAIAAVEDLEELNKAAEQLPGWIRPIEIQGSKLHASAAHPVGSAAAAISDAQAAYLIALQPLSDLDAADMSRWSDISEGIAEATDQLEDATARLKEIDPAASTDANVTVTPATSGVETIVALTTADNATAQVREVVALVSGAQRIAAAREAGSAAAVASAELQAALSTLEELAGADAAVERLALEIAFLDELTTLEDLTDSTLASWGATSATVADRGETMVAAMSLPASEASALAADLREMRSNIDQLVASSKKALAEWRRDVAQAQAQRDEELAALNEYESAYLTHMERYNDLRDATADFTERIRTENVTFNEGYDTFYDGISQREEVRTSMSELSPPDAVRSEHLAVVGVIDGAISAMQAAVEGMGDAQFCYYCSYDETPGWRRFEAESERITEEFGTVTAQWEDAVAAERAALENLKLPAKPEL